jgi:CRP/FNR family transcriptional regulator, cyclic AMP receptor protein
MNPSARPTPPLQPNRSESPPAAPRRARERRAQVRPSDAVAILAGVRSLADLGETVLQRLAARCETLDVAGEQTLFRAGEECVGLYVVASGEVRVSRAGSGHVPRVAAQGEALNGLPLASGERHATSAVTIEAARILFLSRHAVEALYREESDIAHAIIQWLSRRLQELGVRAHALTFRDVVPRLALLLAGYAERVGTPAPNGGVDLELRRTQEELAHEIGTARESVSRAWGQLRDQGLIHPRRGHRLHVPDVERLRAVAGA